MPNFHMLRAQQKAANEAASAQAKQAEEAQKAQAQPELPKDEQEQK